MKMIVKSKKPLTPFEALTADWKKLPKGRFKNLIAEYLGAGGLEGYFEELKDIDGNIPYQEDLDGLIIYKFLSELVYIWNVLGEEDDEKEVVSTEQQVILLTGELLKLKGDIAYLKGIL